MDPTCDGPMVEGVYKVSLGDRERSAKETGKEAPLFSQPDWPVQLETGGPASGLATNSRIYISSILQLKNYSWTHKPI